MQILALQALFTQSLEIVFADERPVRCRGCQTRGRGSRCGHSRRGWMAIGARWTKGTVTLAVCLADGHIAGESEAEAVSEKGDEGEIIV